MILEILSIRSVGKNNFQRKYTITYWSQFRPLMHTGQELILRIKLIYEQEIIVLRFIPTNQHLISTIYYKSAVSTTNRYLLISISYKWKNIKHSCRKNKLEISGITWDEEFELPDTSYSISDIQDYFEHKMHKTSLNYLIHLIPY